MPLPAAPTCPKMSYDTAFPDVSIPDTLSAHVQVKDPKRHFIYVETGFFARWWDEQPDARRNLTRALVANGQLEFINGAWCMHDEASPFYVEVSLRLTSHI